MFLSSISPSVRQTSPNLYLPLRRIIVTFLYYESSCKHETVRVLCSDPGNDRNEECTWTLLQLTKPRTFETNTRESELQIKKRMQYLIAVGRLVAGLAEICIRPIVVWANTELRFCAIINNYYYYKFPLPSFQMSVQIANALWWLTQNQ
jgi:hypothetical protein